MAGINMAAPRLWAQALYTIPRIDPREADPVTRWLVLSRASVVVMTGTSALIGGLLAAREEAFDAPLLILAFLGLVLAHAGSNLVNDFWDFRAGIDSADSPRVAYGPHPLAREGSVWRSFAGVTAAVLLAATAIGVYLTVASGLWVLAFALGGAFVLLFYSGGPLSLKGFGLGELAAFIVWGPLMVGGTYYVLAEELPAWVIVASFPYAFGVTSVLLGKHLDKLSFDAEKGVRTLPILLGEAKVRRLTQALCLAMYASTLAIAIWQQLPALALVVGALPLLRRVLPVFNSPKPQERPRRYPGWPLWFVNFAFLHNRRFGLLFVAALLVQVVAEQIAGGKL